MLNDRLTRGIANRVRYISAVLMVIGLLATAMGSTAAEGGDASGILSKAATTMAGVKSFYFELSTVQGQSTIFQNLELAGVEGSVLRPDRFQAKITARIAIIEVDVQVIGIGTHIWATDPMSSAETYLDLTGDPSESGSSEADTLAALINPDRLLLTAVGLVENPTVDGTEKIEGTETTRIIGTVDLSKIEQFATATPDFAAGLLILGEMPVTIWIDEDGYVISLEVEGPLTTDESPDVVRRLDLFDFDEPVTIEEPPVAE